MTTTTERLGIVETKVENLNEKIDELKIDVKDMHDCLDKTRDYLKGQLTEMYDTSCDQHIALTKEFNVLKIPQIIAGKPILIHCNPRHILSTHTNIFQPIITIRFIGK